MVAVKGDVGDEDLGLSTQDKNELINNVNIIIHSAATLDFHEPLRPTVNINLLGTRRITELSKAIQEHHGLDALVHVSSAYVNSYLTECEERLYDPPAASAEHVIDLVQRKNDEELAKEQSALLGEHPNNYTFTKQHAEREVNKFFGQFPCGIVRPSMSKCQHFPFRRKINNSTIVSASQQSLEHGKNRFQDGQSRKMDHKVS